MRAADELVLLGCDEDLCLGQTGCPAATGRFLLLGASSTKCHPRMATNHSQRSDSSCDKKTLPGASITPTNGTIYLLACTAGVTNESIHRWTETVESMGWGELLHHRCSRVKITANHHFSTHRNENADLVVREHQPCARAFVLFYNFVALYLHQSLTSFD